MEPYYLPIRDEVAVFTAAYTSRLPVLLKGPTGCGKTRFVEHMAYRLGGEATNGIPGNLITVACHEDLTGSDLVGRYLIKGDETIWVDGPLTRAVRSGTICYLDEIVEARKDTIVLIHPLTDHRRLLPIDKKGELLEAHPDFLLVISYNPGYQSALKDLKHSTRQRFVTIEFDYAPRELEAQVITHESGVAMEVGLDCVVLEQRFIDIEQNYGRGRNGHRVGYREEGLCQPLATSRSACLGPQVPGRYWRTGTAPSSTGSTIRQAASTVSSRANRLGSPSSASPSSRS